jgi:hypothetical protein
MRAARALSDLSLAWPPPPLLASCRRTCRSPLASPPRDSCSELDRRSSPRLSLKPPPPPPPPCAAVPAPECARARGTQGDPCPPPPPLKDGPLLSLLPRLPSPVASPMLPMPGTARPLVASPRLHASTAACLLPESRADVIPPKLEKFSFAAGLAVSLPPCATTTPSPRAAAAAASGRDDIVDDDMLCRSCCLVAVTEIRRSASPAHQPSRRRRVHEARQAGRQAGRSPSRRRAVDAAARKDGSSVDRT